jgi:uncharacterized phiE125 gp8 family phage protein
MSYDYWPWRQPDNGWDKAGLVRTAAPDAKPVSLAQAKKQCRIDFADDDDLVQGLLDAAIAQVDGPSGAGIALITQSWRLSLDRWPRPSIVVPLGPVQTIDSLQYIPFGATALTTLDPSGYAYDLDAEIVRIRPDPTMGWPQLQPGPGAIKIAFTCGYGDNQTSVPVDIQQAILLLVSHWYEHRDAVVGVENRDSSTVMPLGVDAILDRYRTGRFA